MARLTLYFCDLCKEPKTQELKYKIHIGLKKATSRKDSNTVAGDICPECYERLSELIKAEINPSSPIPTTTTTPSPLNAIGIISKPGNMVLGHSDGISIVPSNLTDSRRREMNKDKPGECKHSNGFSMEDSGPICKDCNERVTL